MHDAKAIFEYPICNQISWLFLRYSGTSVAVSNASKKSIATLTGSTGHEWFASPAVSRFLIRSGTDTEFGFFVREVRSTKTMQRTIQQTAGGVLPENPMRMYPYEGHVVSLKRRRRMLKKLKKLSTEALRQSKHVDVLSTVEESNEDTKIAGSTLAGEELETARPQTDELSTPKRSIWDSFMDNVRCGQCTPLNPCDTMPQICHFESEDQPVLLKPPNKEQPGDHNSDTTESESTASSKEKAKSMITTLNASRDASVVSDISEVTYETSVWSGITEMETKRSASFLEDSVAGEEDMGEKLEDVIVLLDSLSYQRKAPGALDETDVFPGKRAGQESTEKAEAREGGVQYLPNL